MGQEKITKTFEAFSKNGVTEAENNAFKFFQAKRPILMTNALLLVENCPPFLAIKKEQMVTYIENTIIKALKNNKTTQSKNSTTKCFLQVLRKYAFRPKK